MGRILEEYNPKIIVTNNVRGLGMGTVKAIGKHDALWVHIPHDVQLLTPSGMWFLDGRSPVIWDRDTVRWFFQRYLSRLFSGVDILFAPTSFIAEAHKSRGLFAGTKTMVQYFPTTPSPAQITRQFHGANADRNTGRKLRIAFVGRLSEHKGIPWALGVLCAHNFGAIIDVCGKGELEGTVKKLAAGRGPTVIQYHGQTNASKRTAVLAAADLVVIPSLVQDNSPLLIAEAAELSVPVIAARSGGVPEFISDTWLFNPGDAIDFIRVITKFSSTQPPENTHLPIERPSEKEYASMLIEVCSEALAQRTTPHLQQFVQGA